MIVSSKTFKVAFSLLFAICDAANSEGETLRIAPNTSNSQAKNLSFTIDEFQNVLFTEIHDELDSITHLYDETKTRRRVHEEIQEEASITQGLWSGIVKHGWSQIESSKATSNRSLRRARHTDSISKSSHSSYPFLICDRSSERLTGTQRRHDLIEQMDMDILLCLVLTI